MEELTDKLIDYVAYAHLWHSLEKTHSNEEINYLMLRMTEIEEEISNHYGLPLTLEYSEIFQDLGIKDDFKLSDIRDCTEKLKRAAEDYFKRPVLTDLEMLKRAQKQKMEIDFVLPELSLRLLPYTYYDFCYYFLLLKNKTTPELFLNELQLVEKYDLVRSLQDLPSFTYKKAEKQILKMKKIGLHYIDIYLENIQTFEDNRLEYLGDELPF